MSQLCTIIGEDDFLVAEAAKKFIGDGEGLEVVDSNTSTNEDLQLHDIRLAEESALTPPFLEPRKVTWWKNVRFLPGGGKSDGDDGEKRGPSEAVKEAVAAFAKKLASLDFPDNQKFILSGPKLLATSIVAKTLAAAGEMIVFDSKKKGAASLDRATDRAAELGMQFAPGAAERFLAIVGDDTRSIYSELDKMKSFLGDGETTITAQAVDSIASPGAGVEPSLWAVTDAICARNTAKAVAGARRFEGENGYAIMMTTVIEKQFRQLVELKAAADAGHLEAATRGMNPWAARRMTDNLRLWTLNELRTARMRFMNLRERLVSSSGCNGEDAVAIELVRSLAATGRRGAR